MAYTLACRDIGVDCEYVAKGDTMEAMMADGGKHAKEHHGYTDQQLQDPKLAELVKQHVKQQ